MPNEFQPKTPFGQQIKDKNFFDAFASVIEDAVNLKIVTVVEDEVIDIQSEVIEKDYQGEKGKRMITIINLLDGDIKNVIGRQFMSEYEALRKFHQEQVLDGKNIVQQNLNTLSTTINSLIEIFNKDQETKSRKEERED